MKKPLNKIEKVALNVTEWIGSVSSLLVHTILFLVAFILIIFGYNLDRILLVLTTIVSLEAIYLSIFIQLSVNYQARALESVEKDIDEIQEDVEEIADDIDEIQGNVEDIVEGEGLLQDNAEAETIQKSVTPS